MDSMEVHRLRHHELRLLRCSLPSSPPPNSLQPPPSPPSNQTLILLDSITRLIESGLYLESLSSAASRAVFQYANSFESTDPAEFYAGLEKAVESYLVDEDDDSDASSRVLLVVSIAVAALLAFVQCNIIGPVIELPLAPLPWKVLNEGKEWEAWARIQLMEGGSDLAAKLSNLQYIFFAKILLTKSRDLLFSEKAKAAVGFGTISWWLARLLLLQQRILDEHCSSLLDLLQVLVGESLNCFGDVKKVTSYWRALLDEEEAFSIVAALQLEVGMVEHTFGRVDHAKRHFESATSAVGLELSVTGALGFRTVHQVDPKAQMVLVANRSSLPGASSSQTGGPLHQREASTSEENGYQNREEIKESSESLMTPRITDDAENKMDGKNVNQNGHNTKVILTEIQQAVVLAQCLLLEKSARLDELQRWEMAPYIEAIDSQPSSYFSIKCSCNILRIRWESTRSRTKERALLMMDKAVHDLYEAAPQVSERVHSCFGVFIPAVPLMRKEYGELLVSRGLVGEALKIFEELELWDNLIFCYRSLEKKAAAVELIKMRLLELPNDPRLWCSLGDVTIDDACYEKALEVSKNRSSRAKRSLARSAYNRGDYERSKVLWESAMALNSLYPDGWFALGAAALKARDINKALDGFTRAVQLDPDNGEAWNNIACLHMIRKKSEAAFIAFKEALKLKRNSWQMWENYGEVAADVGNFAQAIEAAKMVFDLSGNKKYDGELLERIMQELERRTSCQSSSISSSDNKVSGSDSANLRQTERLMESFGRVLQQIVRSIGGGDVWGIYARWHKLRGDLTMCSEALLKQVRSYQGSDVWKDIARFRKLANASLELCKIYIEISSSTGSLRELHAADMHLRNTIKQASAFSEAEEYKALQVCLAEVQANLESNSLPT